MTVETNANYISDFNKAYPRNRDLIKEGDDHIRLVKAVLQNTFPGMDGAITATTKKLNQLDSSFSYEGDELTIKNSITIPEGKILDLGGNTVTNAGDPKDPQDLVTLKSLQGSIMWPVGSIFMSIDARNPREFLGFGTWEKFAAGRVIIGSGTTVDAGNETRSFKNEEKGGIFKTKLTEENLPEHTHKATGSTKEAGRHKHGFPAGGGSSASGGRRAVSIDTGVNDAYDWAGEKVGNTPAVNSDGDHKHEVELEIEKTGKGDAFSIVQPYISCNIWVRKSDPAP